MWCAVVCVGPAGRRGSPQRMGRTQRWDGYRDGTATEMGRLPRWDGYRDETATEMGRLQRWEGYRDGKAMAGFTSTRQAKPCGMMPIVDEKRGTSEGWV